MSTESDAAQDRSPGHQKGGWAVSVILALVFIPIGLAKLAALDPAVALFQAWGYPLWFMFTIGVLEVVAGLFVLVPRAASYAAGYLMVEMLGALVTHVVNTQWAVALLPIAVGTAAVYLFWARLPDAFGAGPIARPTRL